MISLVPNSLGVAGPKFKGLGSGYVIRGLHLQAIVLDVLFGDKLGAVTGGDEVTRDTGCGSDHHALRKHS